MPNDYGIHGILEEQGHTMERMTDEITTRMPTTDEVRYLAIPTGVPIIDLLHTSIDQKARPYEVSRFIMRGDRNHLAYDLPVE